MRILVVVEHFPALSETFVLSQVTGLLDLGHDVTIYAVGKPSGTVIQPDVEKYMLLPRTWTGAGVPLSKLKRVLGALRHFPQMFEQCGLRAFASLNPLRHGKQAINLGFFYSCLPLLNRETRFDAIHCHFGDKGLLALAWREMGLIAGPITTVFHAHELAGLTDREGRKLYSPLFRANTLLLPISQRWRERLIHWGAKSERTVVHHMGVDLAKFEFIPSIFRDGVAVQILSVGRLTEQKGYEYAIRSVALLRCMTERELHYTIIGAGELEIPLRQLVTDLGIADIVTFAGPQPQDAVLTHLRAAHIFLLPSVTAANGFQEGIPVALMEAMASGIPVVTTNHSGIPELVEHEFTGFLAEERDAQALAVYMLRIVSNPDLAERLAAAARSKVESEFQNKRLNADLEAILVKESETLTSRQLCPSAIMSDKQNAVDANRAPGAMPSSPRVSVIIPTFNRRHLLTDAVESCLNQSYQNLEVIIVDDGSTDDTGAYVAEQISGPWRGRVQYFRQDNSGASAARNHGSQLALGDFVQYLDSDDLLMPTKIDKQIAILEAPQNIEAACCYCYGAMGVLAQGTTSEPAVRIGHPANEPKELVRQLSTRIVHGMQTSAPLWRRSHLMKHSGWREDISLGDDLEYHIRLLADANKVCFIDEELFFVREHPSPRLSTDQMSPASLASLINTRQAIFATLQKSELWDAQMQHSFLGAMRTIYANALQLGDPVTIRDLEDWLWSLASSPRKAHALKALIQLRRMLGRHFLLGAHRMVLKLRR